MFPPGALFVEQGHWSKRSGKWTVSAQVPEDSPRDFHVRKESQWRKANCSEEGMERFTLKSVLVKNRLR